MKVVVTSILPVGFIELYEDGSYQTGPYSPEQAAGALQAEWRKGKLTVVPLGELLPDLDTSKMKQVPPDHRYTSATFDSRVPGLLEALKREPADWRERFRYFLLLDGYHEYAGRDPGVTRQLVRTFDNGPDCVICLKQSAGDLPSWTGHAEVSLGDRGFFRYELFPKNRVDKDDKTRITMLNRFVVELAAWGKAWGEMPSPGAYDKPFRIVIDRAWSEDRGVISKGCVKFHVEGGDPDFHAVSRAIERAEVDDTATLDEYNLTTKIGYWGLVDADSSFKAGDVIESNSEVAHIDLAPTV